MYQAGAVVTSNSTRSCEDGAAVSIEIRISSLSLRWSVGGERWTAPIVVSAVPWVSRLPSLRRDRSPLYRSDRGQNDRPRRIFTVNLMSPGRSSRTTFVVFPFARCVGVRQPPASWRVGGAHLDGVPAVPSRCWRSQTRSHGPCRETYRRTAAPAVTASPHAAASRAACDSFLAPASLASPSRQHRWPVSSCGNWVETGLPRRSRARPDRSSCLHACSRARAATRILNRHDQSLTVTPPDHDAFPESFACYCPDSALAMSNSRNGNGPNHQAAPK